ncbi:MAG: hypothetical protein FJ299_04790 [Planctomycetes bacterium]|nr:hypothetical protein [Planctomycetota bacterium]
MSIRLLLVVLCLSLCVPLLSAQKKKGPPRVKVGDTVDYTFQVPAWNAPEYRGLADLRGRPVVVQFWSPDQTAVVDTDLPKLVQLAQTWSGSAHVIGVRFGEADPGELDELLVARKLLGADVIWLYEVPFVLDGGAPNSLALLGPDGKLETFGAPADVRDGIYGRLAGYQVAAAALPDGAPSKLRKACEAHGKHEYAASFATLRELEKDAKHGETAKTLLTRYKAELDLDLELADRALELGRIDRVDRILARLNEGLKGDAVWKPRLEEIGRRADAAPVQKERAAFKKLAVLEKKLYEKVDKALPKALDELAAAHPGTQAAERARRLAAAARGALPAK